MCNSNNINILNGGGEKKSKIEFETSFVPPPDYKSCNKNKKEERNNKNSFSKTIFSTPPKSVKDVKEKEKRNWYLAGSPWHC